MQETRAAELRREQRSALLQQLTACEVDVAGHEGYMKVGGFIFRTLFVPFLASERMCPSEHRREGPPVG